MYAVETNSLTKSFNGFKAVDNLNLRVPQGSIYGFLGPNGAGKTTTIKMLIGLSKPDSGDIKINDKNVSFGSLKNRNDIGFLPDVPNFYNWMTPVEFLKFTGELFSIDNNTLKKRTDNLLELVGLQGVKKKIGGFSRGMKQRLGIAQALINDPKVLFLDEPTSALDPIGRKDVMDIIATLSGKVTVFFSTHILSDVERICDRVVILNKGKMMIEDSIENLRKSYSLHSIVLKIATGDTSDISNELNNQDWVDKATIEGNGEIRLLVNDMNRAQHDISRVLYEKNAGLREFNILEPSLEDIFLRVVND